MTNILPYLFKIFTVTNILPYLFKIFYNCDQHMYRIFLRYFTTVTSICTVSERDRFQQDCGGWVGQIGLYFTGILSPTYFGISWLLRKNYNFLMFSYLPPKLLPFVVNLTILIKDLADFSIFFGRFKKKLYFRILTNHLLLGHATFFDVFNIHKNLNIY